jgi:arylsulfatase A-like enzyme
LDENTIVMIASDNGVHVECGNDPDFWDSNGPLRGYKRDLTEGGIRTPMLARWPGKIRAGSETDHISAFWDVMPTLCELAGCPAPDGIDGISFAPTLLGREQPKHDYLYWEFTSKRDKTGQGKQAVRMGQWKGIQSGSNFQLYNILEDVGETRNLAESHPEVVDEIKAIMSQAHVDSELFPLNVDKATQKKDPWLGWHRPVDANAFVTNKGNNHDSVC